MKFSLEQWRDVTRVFYEVTPLGDPSRFAAEAVAQLHGRLICTQARFTEQGFTHEPSRIKGVDHNFLLYERYFVGEGRGLASDEAVQIDRASVHLIDMSRRYRSITSDVVTAGVCIPHEVIGYDPSRDPAYRIVPIATPQGRMLDLAHANFRFAVARGQADAEELAAAFLAMVRMLMLNGSDSHSIHQQDIDRRPLLRSYIGRNLEDPNLSPERVCRELGISRTVLYREFQEEGGVIKFITDRRLDRCFAALMATTGGRGAVRRVAERWGFHHAGNFHRSFRHRFGMAPSDCLQQDSPRVSPTDGGTYHPVHEWMRDARS